MTIYQILRLLFQETILSEEQYKKLTWEEETRPISIHWEVRIFLLLGISFLCGGLGTLVYKNIETIGHQAIIGLIMPIEWALTLAGIAFLALAYFLMHYLKTPRHGFSYLPQRNKNNLIEALVVNQFLQQTPSTASDDSVKYGGGDFGASGDF
jgi:hypothetical protein